MKEPADQHEYLARGEFEHHQEVVALHRARLGSEPCIGLVVGEVLADDLHLGENLPVVELEGRHVTLRVDLPVVLSGRGLLVGYVHLLEIELVAGFAQHDVGRHRAGAGSVVQFHGPVLSNGLKWELAWRLEGLRPNAQGKERCLKSTAWRGEFPGHSLRTFPGRRGWPPAPGSGTRAQSVTLGLAVGKGGPLMGTPRKSRHRPTSTTTGIPWGFA